MTLTKHVGLKQRNIEKGILMTSTSRGNSIESIFDESIPVMPSNGNETNSATTGKSILIFLFKLTELSTSFIYLKA